MNETRKISIAPTRDAEDWAFIRRVCCETGNAGGPIDRARWEFFAENWVGPYEKLERDSALIAWVDGERAGYLTGSDDTVSFRRKKFFLFSLPLAARILAGRYAKNNDTKRFLRRTFHLDTGPEESFPREVRARLFRKYPAHLHMNVDARFRSLGLGHLLVEAYRERLRSRGIPGGHLFCGDQPLRFYAREGFHEVARLEFRPGVIVYALATSSASPKSRPTPSPAGSP